MKLIEGRGPEGRRVWRRLWRSSLWGAVGRIGSIVVGLLLTSLLTRELTAAEYGSFAVAVSIVSFGGLVVSFGLDQQVFEEVGGLVAQGSGDEASDTLGRVYTTVLLTSVLLLGLWFLGGSGRGLLSGVLEVPALLTAQRMLVAWIILGGIMRVNQAVFRSADTLREAVAFGPEGARVLTLAFLGVWLVLGYTVDLAVAVAIAVCGYLTSAVIGLARLRRAFRSPFEGVPRLDGRWWVLLRRSVTLLAFTILTFLRTEGDLWFLSAVQQKSDVALYAVVWKVARITILPLAIVSWGLPALIAESYAKGDRLTLERITSTAANWATFVACLFVGVIGLFGGKILGVMFGEFYLEGHLLLLVLCLGLLPDVLAGPATTTLVVTGHRRYLLVVTAATTAIAVPVYTIGAMRGVLELCIAVGICNTFQAVLTWVGVRRKIGVSTGISLL